MPNKKTAIFGDTHPYAARYGLLAKMPSSGMTQAEILGQIREMGTEEDKVWADGQCSGTMYCGDKAHYAFLNDVFSSFSHVNALQRDICPSQTRFESEIIAMTLDMMHGDAVKITDPDSVACGVIGSGGTDSIITPLLAYRDKYRAERNITQPEIILPVTAHPAFEKGAHLFGIKIVYAPIDPVSTQVDMDFVARHINANTIALVGSAGNYPYGTIDPIDQLSDLALKHGIGLHVDACLGGFILPWGEALGYDIPVFDFRLPGVTSISADTHKYGYALKGTSVALYRDTGLREYQYYLSLKWLGGIYGSPGISGSRSGGLLAATWASLASLGRDGFQKYAKAIFETAFRMQDVVKSHPELRLMGDPTFCFSFTSDEFDIYHVNDFMKQRGWRFNGQQFPSAIHMCVTRPQTQTGVVDRFRDDLQAAIVYAKDPPHPVPSSGALYGGAGTRALAKDLDVQAVRRAVIHSFDACLALPEDG